MSDVVKITSEIDTLCNCEIECAHAQKMRWLGFVCASFLSVALGSVALYAAYSKRKLYPLIATAILYPLTYKFFCDGHRSWQKAETIKQHALKAIEAKFKDYLAQRNAPNPKQISTADKTAGIKDLVLNNAGTISSGAMIVLETAMGFPIHFVLKRSTSLLIHQLINQPSEKEEKTTDPVVETIFEIEYRRLVLQAVVECYERYMDEATILRFKSVSIKVPSLKSAITDHLKADLADEVIKQLKRKNLIEKGQIEPFKEQTVPKIIEAITSKLTDIEADWVKI